MEEISEIGPASEADAPSGILCNTTNNDSISNSISNSINKSTKERKKLYRHNKNIVEEDALYEQGFDDYCRPSINKKKNWKKFKPYQIITFHQTRRLKHFITLLDDSNGLRIDEYFETKLDLILKNLTVMESGYYTPYIIIFKCPKDTGDCAKECMVEISIDVLIDQLEITKKKVKKDIKDQITIYLERIKGKIIEKCLEMDKKMKKHKGFAKYTCCPRIGCKNSNGFLCNPVEREYTIKQGLRNIKKIGKIITCPENGCEKKWCTLCDEDHEENEKCIIPDPRKKMTKEELQFHDDEVKAGREQWCPECFACHSKDENCDKVTCPRCNTKYCFGCGERLNNTNYLEEHLTMGPVSEMYPDGHLGCRKTLIRWAAQDRAGHREWLSASIRSRPLMRDVQHVIDDKLRPLEEEEIEFLNEIIANAMSIGIL